MRLFHIDKPGCHHITEIMPGVKAVYQMEQEFFPYLTVEFLPHRDTEEPGIILVTKTKTIRKYYTFDTQKDIDDLRNLIWEYLVQDYNIKDITKNGCLTNFYESSPNKVVSGWKNNLREKNKDICCKQVSKIITSNIVKYGILHDVYKVKTKDEQDRHTCKQNRYHECINNFPQGSPIFKRCMDEVNWLCDRGYPNKKVMKSDQLVNKVRNDLMIYLKSNNMKVNKQKFDEIINAGLFDDISTRAGNKVRNYKNINSTVDDILRDNRFGDRVIEGFGGRYVDLIYDNFTLFIFVMIILFICIGCGKYYS